LTFQSSLGPRGPGVQQRRRSGELSVEVSILARPSRDGRPVAFDSLRATTGVSILARPSRAGRRRSSLSTDGLGVVSILARPSRAGRLDVPHRHVHVFLVSILARPSRAGRLGCHNVLCAAGVVSILARPSRAGRPWRSARASPASCLFQSSLGPRGPGVKKSISTGAAVSSFNPRSALAGRASRAAIAFTLLTKQFQSSLGPRGPGVMGPPAPVCQATRFNPRSALAGRASAYHGLGITAGYVSILARPSRAGRPALRTRLHALLRRFNPRSALAGRASMMSLDSRLATGVSILARPSRAGRPPSSSESFPRSRFQSSLGPRGPGVLVRQHAFYSRGGFNPRSALAGRASR